MRPPAWWLLLTALATSTPMGVAMLPAQTSDTVWVNTRSGVYHCRGTTYFGKTVRGRYMPEMAARAAGHRANGGQACTAGRPAAEDSVERSPLGVMGFTGPALVVPPLQPQSGLAECRLTDVTDGDTIRCDPLGRIRLIGVDTPERNQEPFGSAASAALASMVPLGATLQVERDATERDSQGRLLAYLWYEGEMLNWRLIRYGWGVSLPYPTTPRYNRLFDATEVQARAEGRGLWHLNGFACRPVDHRRRRC